MNEKQLIKAAQDAGLQQAQATLKQREALATAKAKTVKPAAGLKKALGVTSAAQPTARTWLIAEGDSWFDFPFNDVLKSLEDDYGYEIESVANAGDTIEGMAYGGGQLDSLVRRLERMLRHQHIPKAILLSGGGNDVAGDEFAMLLNHALSPRAGLNQQVVSGVIDERVRLAYITVITAVTTVCANKLGKAIPVVIHGYDYPVPDGRGVLGGWGPLPGPWLEPGFKAKGYTGEAPADVKGRLTLLRDLMDRFNTMLAGLPQVPGLSHVRYVDLRKTLSQSANYKDWWSDELHPTGHGFKAVAAKFHKHIVEE